MAEQTKKYTTCPFTGAEDSWSEEEIGDGKWKGRSSANGGTISSENYEGLRLRYQKLTLARLTSNLEEEN